MRGDIENAPVKFLGEMLGLEEIGDAVEGVVVDEDRAKQRLFRLDIMRRQPERGIGALARRVLSARFSIAGIGILGWRSACARAESVR